MNVLWNSEDWLSPGEVQERMPEGASLAYTTVMTVLSRLWKKGRVDRQKKGRAYAYAAVQGREEFAASQMSGLLSAAPDHAGVLSQFVDDLSTEDRRRLRGLLKPK